MRSLSLVVLALAGVLAGADAPPGDAIKNDVKQFQGVWSLQATTTEGEETPKDKLPPLRLVIKGDRWTYAVGGKSVFQPEPKFSVDPMAKPKTIDVVSVKKKGANLLRGIYVLEGDTLRICFAVGDADRPREFKSEPGSKSGISVYKRVKE